MVVECPVYLILSPTCHPVSVQHAPRGCERCHAEIVSALTPPPASAPHGLAEQLGRGVPGAAGS